MGRGRRGGEGRDEGGELCSHDIALVFAMYLPGSQRRPQGVVELVSSWVFGSRMEAYSPGMFSRDTCTLYIDDTRQGFIQGILPEGGDDGWGSNFSHIHMAKIQGVSKSGGYPGVPPLYKTLLQCKM